MKLWPDATITWRKDGFSEYESLWSFIHKYRYLNRITLSELRKTLTTKERAPLLWRKATQEMASLDDFDIKLIKNLTKIPEDWLLKSVTSTYRANNLYFKGTAGVSPALRYCPECIKSGFHATQFQFLFIEQCPIHEVPLRDTCPSCHRAIEYALKNDLFTTYYGCVCGYCLWQEIDKPWTFKLRAKNRLIFGSISHWLNEAEQGAFRQPYSKKTIRVFAGGGDVIDDDTMPPVLSTVNLSNQVGAAIEYYFQIFPIKNCKNSTLHSTKQRHKKVCLCDPLLGKGDHTVLTIVANLDRVYNNFYIRLALHHLEQERPKDHILKRVNNSLIGAFGQVKDFDLAVSLLYDFYNRHYYSVLLRYINQLKSLVFSQHRHCDPGLKVNGLTVTQNKGFQYKHCYWAFIKLIWEFLVYQYFGISNDKNRLSSKKTMDMITDFQSDLSYAQIHIERVTHVAPKQQLPIAFDLLLTLKKAQIRNCLQRAVYLGDRICSQKKINLTGDISMPTEKYCAYLLFHRQGQPEFHLYSELNVQQLARDAARCVGCTQKCKRYNRLKTEYSHGIGTCTD